MESGFASAALGMKNYKRAAAEQGGLLSGKDPTEVNLADPLRLWIIQVGVIILMTQILALGLRKLRQPKVIAEVLGGIILGPTAFGRIPGFTEHIFPADSRPFLSLVANLGLCLFIFLIGLELESAVIKRNARLSAMIALAGMAIPFGFGVALSVPLYNHFIDKSIAWTNFMLFTGVAYSITAFPVLCRILTELQLLDTTVGIVVLSAGVGNDIVGWILLALAIGLVNGGQGLTALYILLTCVAWTIFMLFGVKRAIYWLGRKTGSIESGRPTVFFMTMVILTLFGSAFFTDVIGVHAIFGAFLAGIIVPREGGLAIHLTEKLEDMVSIIFLPLYFTLSGLSTDLGLLDNGITWGFTVAICVLAYIGKFGGCTLAARYAAGFSWREASTIGSLMSCKGLIELIVLNVGLSAGILSQRVFSMFVLEALLLTFLTTPAVVALYPPRFRTRAVPAGANFANVVDGAGGKDDKESSAKDTEKPDEDGWKTRITVVLDRMEHVSGMMTLTQLIQPPSAFQGREASDCASMHTVSVEALRLIELTDNIFSGVMKSNVAESLLQTDPLLSIFRTFSELHDLPVSTALSVVRYDDLAGSVAEHATMNASQLIVVPWLPPIVSAPLSVEGENGPRTPGAQPSTFLNPFDSFFYRSGADTHQPSAIHSTFVRGVFARAPCDVALFIDRGHAPEESRTASSRHHLVLPFFGGPDDRFALHFVVQLCADPRISATIIKVTKTDGPTDKDTDRKSLGGPPEEHAQRGLTVQSTSGFPDTIYAANTQTRLQSETADSVAWAKYADAPTEPRSAKLASAISRIQFGEIASPQPLHAVLDQANEQLQAAIKRRARLLVVTGRSRRLAVESHAAELKTLMEEYGSASAASEVRKTIGDVATAFVAARSYAGLIVLQANTPSVA